MQEGMATGVRVVELLWGNTSSDICLEIVDVPQRKMEKKKTPGNGNLPGFFVLQQSKFINNFRKR